MIDPAPHIAEQDLGFELERSLVCRFSRRGIAGQHCEASQYCGNRLERI
jgi:hypothetical protein